MKKTNGLEYFESKSYIGYIAKKIKHGDVWKFCQRVFKNISRYTIINRIIRVSGFILSIIEKSAVLILLTTALLIALPILILSLLIYTVICTAKFLFNYKEITKKLNEKKNIVIIITKMNILSKNGDNLVNRYIKKLDDENNCSIVLVTGDRFVSIKRCSENIYALKVYFFFVLKRYCIEKNRLNVIYIVL